MHSDLSCTVVAETESVFVAPSDIATSSRFSGSPIMVTLRAPAKPASRVDARPTGPEPWITTSVPPSMVPSLDKPLKAVGIAQPNAMTLSGAVSGGTLIKVHRLLIVAYSRNPAALGPPAGTGQLRSLHRNGLEMLHSKHVPQGVDGSQ